jgi:hypothetical protein
MRVRHRGWCQQVLVSLAVIAAACGGSDGETPAGVTETAARASRVTSLDDLDACSLLTADEIRSATGHAPGDGADPLTLQNAAPMCAWPSSDGSVRQVVQLLVTYAPDGTFEEYRDRMKQEQTAITRIDGPGRYTISISEVNMFQAIGDRRMLQVMVEPAAGIDPAAAAVALLRAAFARVE